MLTFTNVCIRIIVRRNIETVFFKRSNVWNNKRNTTDVYHEKQKRAAPAVPPFNKIKLKL